MRIDFESTEWNKEYNINRCLVTGYGKTESEKHILRQLDMKIILNNECQSTLRRYTRLGRKFRLQEGSMCAKADEIGEMIFTF